MSMKEKLKYDDGLGNTFKNIGDMCKFHQVSTTTYRLKTRAGLSPREIFSNVSRKGLRTKFTVPCKDHLGNEYHTTRAMCEAWNIDYDLYLARLRNGFSVQKALEKLTPSDKDAALYNGLVDMNGVKYKTLTAMCQAWGISVKCFVGRIERGWSFEEALSIPADTSNPVKRHSRVSDHVGNKFTSVNAMCKYWDVNLGTYKYRVKHGLSVEEALTKKINRKERKG